MSAQGQYNPFPPPDYHRKLGEAMGRQDMLGQGLGLATRLWQGPLVTHGGRNYAPTVLKAYADREERRRREEQERDEQRTYEQKRREEERTYAEKQQAARRAAESLTWKERFEEERKAAIEDYERRKAIDAKHAKPEKPVDPLEEAAKRIARMTGMADAQAATVPVDQLKAADSRESIEDLAETEGVGTDEVVADAIQRRREEEAPGWKQAADAAIAAAEKAEAERRKLMLDDAKRTAEQYPLDALQAADSPDAIRAIVERGGAVGPERPLDEQDMALIGALQQTRNTVLREQQKATAKETAADEKQKEADQKLRASMLSQAKKHYENLLSNFTTKTAFPGKTVADAGQLAAQFVEDILGPDPDAPKAPPVAAVRSPGTEKFARILSGLNEKERATMLAEIKSNPQRVAENNIDVAALEREFGSGGK